MHTDLPFNERGVTLSRSALSAAGQMFALRDLSAATVVMVPRQKPLPVTVSVLGMIALATGIAIGSGPTFVLGLMVAVVGYLAWITQDVIYQLMVTTPEGEREVLITQDQEFAERVAAMVRGLIDERTAHAAA
jgi:hypothetical protein